MKTYVLFNRESNNKAGKAEAEQLSEIWKTRDLEFVDAVKLEDYAGFFKALEPADARGDVLFLVPGQYDGGQVGH